MTGVISVIIQIVTKLMKNLEIWTLGFCTIENNVWWTKGKLFTFFKLKLRIIGFELSKQSVEIWHKGGSPELQKIGRILQYRNEGEFCLGGRFG